MKACRDYYNLEADQSISHLDLLIKYLDTHFKSTIGIISRLFEEGNITFGLLWTLFSPKTVVYSVCGNSEQSQCTILDSCEEKKDSRGETHFALNVHHIGYRGKSFREVSSTLMIPEFPGVKPINSLAAFPLQHHEKAAEIKVALIARGMKFRSLAGIYHCLYRARTRET